MSVNVQCRLGFNSALMPAYCLLILGVCNACLHNTTQLSLILPFLSDCTDLCVYRMLVHTLVSGVCLAFYYRMAPLLLFTIL